MDSDMFVSCSYRVIHGRIYLGLTLCPLQRKIRSLRLSFALDHHLVQLGALSCLVSRKAVCETVFSGGLSTLCLLQS